MLDLFLLVCLKTAVNCSEVGVAYANTLPKAWVKKYEELIAEKGNEN